MIGYLEKKKKKTTKVKKTTKTNKSNAKKTTNAKIDKEIASIFKLFDIMIGLADKESEKEMKLLFAANTILLNEYGVKSTNQDKYIRMSTELMMAQVLEILPGIDSDKVLKLIFPKLIGMVVCEGVINEKRLEFLDMIGNVFVESGTMPKELLESFLEKVNKKNKKDSKKKSSSKSPNIKDDINHDMVAIIHLFNKMGSYGVSNKEGKEYFIENTARLLMDAHDENDSPQESGKKYKNLADNLSEDRLIKIISKFNQTKSDDVFKLLLGLSVVGENVTKDSVALLQFLAKNTNLSESNMDMMKQASTML